MYDNSYNLEFPFCPSRAHALYSVSAPEKYVLGVLKFSLLFSE